MLTLIIGKNSNLSQHLAQKIPNCVLISSREISSDVTVLSSFKDTKISIIFNNFQTASRLNDTDNLEAYVENSIVVTAKVLDYFKNTAVDKMIYTSSSSVYGNNILCNETDEVKPLNLHASLKVSNEKMIEKYCTERQIDYTVARIFNMYGGEDRFSIVSKIINAVQNGQSLTVINNGNAIRDFIHIDDVINVYEHLLQVRNLPRINIGSGNGTSIKNILTFLKNNGIKVITDTQQRDELKISTADNTLMVKLLGRNVFRDVETYLLDKLRT